jgi:hypothetical protein
MRTVIRSTSARVEANQFGFVESFFKKRTQTTNAQKNSPSMVDQRQPSNSANGAKLFFSSNLDMQSPMCMCGCRAGVSCKRRVEKCGSPNYNDIYRSSGRSILRILKLLLSLYLKKRSKYLFNTGITFVYRTRSSFNRKHWVSHSAEHIDPFWNRLCSKQTSSRESLSLK